MGNLRQDRIQLEIADEIADQFAKGIKIVVAAMPTGSGKSGVSGFVHQKAQLSAAVLSHQKILQDQYQELLFDGDVQKFITLKGRDNYPCKIRTKTTAAFAPCAFTDKFKCHKKSDCPYIKTKKTAEVTSFLNTNYQLIGNMLDHQPEFTFRKQLYIYDEAHNIHQLYTDYRSPRITNVDLKLYEKQGNFARDHDIKSLEYPAQNLLNAIKSIDFKRKDDDDYLFEKIAEIYELKDINAEAIGSYMKRNLDDLIETGYIYTVGAIDKIECKSRMAYNIVKQQRQDFEDCIVELHQQEDKKFSLTMTAFDIGTLFGKEAELYSDYKLFMSATILGGEKFLKNLGLDKEPHHIMDLPSRFPVENRKIYLLPGIGINYNVINKEPAKLESTLEMTKQLILGKAEKGESGIVFTSSYDLTRIVTNYLQIHLPEEKVQLLFNMSTIERTDILEAFKLKGDVPKVLVSCSFFEGVNLNADISRYSIIFKVPYRSLGSKYVKAVMERNHELYSIGAMTDIIQACGRSVRSEDDGAESYIFDGNARRLFKNGKKFLPKGFAESLEGVS